MSPFKRALPRIFNDNHSWGNANSLLSNHRNVQQKPERLSISRDIVYKKSSDDPLLKRLRLQVNSQKVEREKVLHSFLCNICAQKFTTAFNRNRHKKTCNPSCKFRCSRCSRGFTSRSDVAAHVVESHWLKCSKCPSRFSSKKQLVKHHKSHDQKCSTCGKQFRSSRRLLRHIRTHTKKYSCVMCKRRFTTRYELQFHMNAHKGKRPYKCGKCSCSFSKPTGLSGHMKMHTSSKTALTVSNSNKYR